MDATAPLQKADAPDRRYELDQESFIVEFTVQGGKFRIAHKLRRPKYQELRDREKLIKNEATAISKEETSSSYSDRDANLWLWDEIVEEIRGYDIGDGQGELWRAAEPLKQAIPGTHKEAAIKTLYAANARLSETEDESSGFRLAGAGAVEILLEIGVQETPDYVIEFTLRSPRESEWTKYQAQTMDTREIRTPGSRDKTRRIRIVRNLGAAVELFNNLLEGVKGLSLKGEDYTPQKRELFLQAIDAVHKQIVVQALEERFTFDLGN